MSADFPVAVFVVQAAGAAFVALALLSAARTYGRGFLRSWAIAAGALALSALCGALNLVLARDVVQGHVAHHVVAGIALASKYAELAWLLIGVRELFNRPAPAARTQGFLGIGIAAAAAIIIAVTVPAPGALRSLLRLGLAGGLCAGAWAYSAWTMGSLARRRGGVGPWLLSGTFALFGLEEVRHVASVMLPALGVALPAALSRLGFVDLVLDAGLGVGSIALLLEEESAHRSASAARAEAALAALSESERQQRLVLENVDEVIWSFSRDGHEAGGSLRLASLSGRVRDILGQEADEMLADPGRFRALVHGDDLPRIEAAWDRMARSRQPEWYEYRLRHPDTGTHRWIEERVTPQFDDGGTLTGLFGVARDVTERKSAADALRRSEEQVLQAQKMEAVGRLAGGVAHDFNNLLTVIAGHADLLLETLPADDPRRPDAEAIEKAAGRATALVRQLLVFSRRQIFHPQVLDLRDLLGELHGMLTRLIGEDVRLTPAFDPFVGPIRGDRSQIEQVVVNLVVNARDAMPNGGAVVIEVRDAAPRDEPVLERLGVSPGPYVVLAVHDTGIGIDAETRARLFEPFFTTKEPGRGTGLGLAIVYGIVRQSGGHIDVRSEAGRGSSFSIYFPRAVEGGDVLPAGAPGAAPRQVVGPRVILVVEDEDAVRRFVVAALRSRGHRVLEANSGEAALATAASLEGGLDLLLTDVVMPGMRGSELAAKLLETRPDLRVAFMTGYTDDATWKVAQATGHLVIAKPFTAETLALAVREALQGPSERVWLSP